MSLLRLRFEASFGQKGAFGLILSSVVQTRNTVCERYQTYFDKILIINCAIAQLSMSLNILSNGYSGL